MSTRLYAHAVRSARPRQLVGRASRPLRRRLFPRAVAPAPFRPLEQNRELWLSPAFAERRSAPDGLLAAFVANYGDDVLAHARAGDGPAARAVAERWVASSPPRVDAPWHPYVISTRTANWIAAATLTPELATATIVGSLRRQLTYLARNVEDDILGNHVLRNAKALVLGGTALGDDTLLGRGRRLLARELPEQVLADGGHYERSPAYHRLVLLDLLEVEQFAPVADAVARMTGFAVASSRPDGAPALFNDGGVDVAPNLSLAAPADGLDVRRESGYAFARRTHSWLAFDCGAPSPPYLPPHAHADALSFQLWIDGRAAVVDPGTSTYAPGPVRLRERGTEAHSTVAPGGDQFELWGAFRSGPLPAVRLLSASDEALVGEAVLPRGITHRRTLRFGDGSLSVEDTIEGHGTMDLVTSIPLAPDAPVQVAALSGESSVEPRSFAERFGERREATAVVQRMRVSLPWEGGWELRWS